MALWPGTLLGNTASNLTEATVIMSVFLHGAPSSHLERGHSGWNVHEIHPSVSYFLNSNDGWMRMQAPLGVLCGEQTYPPMFCYHLRLPTLTTVYLRVQSFQMLAALRTEQAPGGVQALHVATLSKGFTSFEVQVLSTPY